MPSDDKITAALVRSIAQVGQLQPAIADEHGQIVDGRRRIEACAVLKREPWIERRQGISPEIYPHTLIRTSIGVADLALLANQAREKLTPDGARRAPSTGRIQEAVAKQLEEDFGLKVSPRLAAQAMQVGRLSPAEQEVIRSADPPSMRAALRTIDDQGLGQVAYESDAVRVEHLRRVQEFRAFCRRTPVSNLTTADMALYDDLIEVLRNRKAEWEAHATAR